PAGTCYFAPKICSSLPSTEKAPAIDGRGKLARADSALPALNQEGETVGAEHPLVARPASGRLVHQRQKFARRSQGPPHSGTKTLEIDQFEAQSPFRDWRATL